jgi:hypothetical protein
VTRAAVAVPAHKARPDADELTSLGQAVRVLARYSIHLVVPGTLDVSVYTERFPSLVVTRVPEHFFGSIDAHNRMLMSPEFYELFTDHEYVLVHHLDAFTFHDDLDRWCERGYDYVGPPWFDGFDQAAPDAPLIGVGNGGFSLRKVSTFVHVTRLLETAETRGLVSRLPDKLRLVLRRSLLPASRRLRMPRDSYERLFAAVCARFPGNEDNFWGLRVPVDLPGFRVVDAYDAIDFAFEYHPARLYEMNGRSLPFGCHGWTRYDRAFWQPFIDSATAAGGQ